MHAADAPVAVGRSGLRVEKGVSSGGLCGEIMRLERDPSVNSFSQRAWMYTDDPAMTVLRNGIPSATYAENEGNSLILKSSIPLSASFDGTKQNFGIRSIISGDAITKCKYNVID